MMETTDFIRQTLNRITPEVLKGELKLTRELEGNISTALKKEAVKQFAAGKMTESKEIDNFIKSKPKFKIWSGNGVLFMMQNTGANYDTIIIYSKPDHVGEYEKLLQKVEEIQSKSNE